MQNIELERLEIVAKKYFNSLSNVAKMIGKQNQTFYSYRKRPGLGRMIIQELKEKLNINPEYIKFGQEPMLLNEKKIQSNVAEVTYSEFIELPDIRTMRLEQMTPQQMKRIKEWTEENIPKIEKILETIGNTEEI